LGKVVNFAQTPLATRNKFYGQRGLWEEIMATPKSGRHKEYARYAEHCLNLVTSMKNRKDRSINREMAAEWLRLADATIRPLKPAK
jgi:hypothetical protein